MKMWIATWIPGHWAITVSRLNLDICMEETLPVVLEEY